MRYFECSTPVKNGGITVLGGLSSAAEAGAMAAKADNLLITGQSAAINTLGGIAYTAASGSGASAQTGGNKSTGGN